MWQADTLSDETVSGGDGENGKQIYRLSNYIGCIVTFSYFIVNTFIFSQSVFYNKDGLAHSLFLGVTLLICLVASKWFSIFSCGSRRDYNFSKIERIILFFILLSANFSIIIALVLMPGLNRFHIEPAGSNKIQSSAIELLIAGVLGPAVEEIQFRGVYLNALKKYGAGFAILTSSVVFALLHPGIRFFIALVLGIFTGILMIITGKVIWPIFYHSIYNTTLLFLENEKSIYFMALCICIFMGTALSLYLAGKTYLRVGNIKKSCLAMFQQWKKDKIKYEIYFSSWGMVIMYLTFGLPGFLMMFQGIMYGLAAVR